MASEAEALQFAQEYCKARGRMAQFERMEILTYHNVASQSAFSGSSPRAVPDRRKAALAWSSVGRHLHDNADKARENPLARGRFTITD